MVLDLLPYILSTEITQTVQPPKQGSRNSSVFPLIPNAEALLLLEEESISLYKPSSQTKNLCSGVYIQI